MVAEDALPLPYGSSQERLNVFIVDDSEIELEGLVQMCKAFGWRAAGLSSGTELVHRIQELVDANQPLPDALVVDWQMPDVDGIEALNMVAERLGSSDLPATLIVSAHERDRVASHDRSGVVNRILTKPVDSNTLFNAVNASVAAQTGRPHQVAAPTQPDTTSGPWLEGLRILLVDDSDINLEVARRMLEKEGATVEVRMNGEEALQALTAMKDSGVVFDAVLMDLQMPVMDGYEATQRARKELHLTDLPIIALTAGALTEERLRAEAAGMDAFLTKPLDPARLVRTVRAQASKSRRTPTAHRNISAAPTSSAESGWPEIEGILTSDAVRLMHGDVDLFGDLLHRFLREYGTGFSRLAQGHSPAERAALIARVHKLRGSSGMLGATRLHSIASELETRLRGWDDPPARHISNMQGVTDLTTALNESLRQLAAAASAALAVQVEVDGRPHAHLAEPSATPPQEQCRRTLGKRSRRCNICCTSKTWRPSKALTLWLPISCRG